ncbi:MAG: LapA family protein, partial [Burkholderiales bacterium]|nr:LapA family protein [Burkholderiales bacterium]
MQLLLVFGVAFAIAAVLFALQNNVPVTVAFLVWRVDGSLAVVLLLALGLGVISAGLVSSPTVIRAQWNNARQKRALAALESEKAALERRIGTLEAELAQARAAAAVPAPAAPERAAPAGGAR